MDNQNTAAYGAAQTVAKAKRIVRRMMDAVDDEKINGLELLKKLEGLAPRAAKTPGGWGKKK